MCRAAQVVGAAHLSRVGMKCTQRPTASKYKIKIKPRPYEAELHAPSQCSSPVGDTWYLLNFGGVNKGPKNIPQDWHHSHLIQNHPTSPWIWHLWRQEGITYLFCNGLVIHLVSQARTSHWV